MCECSQSKTKKKSCWLLAPLLLTDSSHSPCLMLQLCVCVLLLSHKSLFQGLDSLLLSDPTLRGFRGSTLCYLLTLICTEGLQPLQDPTASCKKLFSPLCTSITFQLNRFTQDQVLYSSIISYNICDMIMPLITLRNPYDVHKSVCWEPCRGSIF